MKQRPILIIAILITIILEIVLMILVYNKVGNIRLPAQLGRLTFQLIFIIWVLSSKSNTALFLLMAYHIVTGLLILNSKNSVELFGKLLIGYHFVIGLIIYLHDWLEINLNLKKVENL